MASAAKPSRSKTPPTSGEGFFSGDHEIAHVTGNDGPDLSDKLKVFKTSQFDPGAYVTSKCQTMSEKEIRHLCSHLRDLKKASAEEMRKSVYANYSAFIRTSKEISDLEGELLSIRNLLSTQAALVHVLAEGALVDSLSTGCEGSSEEYISNFEHREASKIEKWCEEFPDTLEVLLFERRVDEALAALEEGEVVAKEAEEKQTLSPDALILLKNSITEQRQKLAEQLAETACQSSTRRADLRSAISALKKLGDGPRAHTLLLNAHHQRLRYSVQSLRPLRNSYGGAYTASLAQLVFSAIAEAACDSSQVFKELAYASELVTWSVRRTEDFALLVKRHALSSLVASGGLRAAAECVKKSLGYCSLLEESGLALCPVLLKLFRPCVEQALRANLKRIEESTATLAAADNWVLSYPPVGIHPSGKVIAAQPKLSSSAHRFNSMVQEFFEDVSPLLSMQLGSATLEGLLQVFTSYVNLLINALPGSMEDEGNLEGCGNRIVCMAENEEQQLALLANASLLADELLPLAATKLASVNHGGRNDEPLRRASDRQSRVPEQREWKRRVQRSVDRLRDSFCRQHALDLIFTEDGDTRLNADMYISMDGHTVEPEWFPSPIYQELFMKLNRIACIAVDVFVRRERFASLLLVRLIETFIMWLSNDQSFWADIEDSRGLGPLGLQQFYLDMQFVILFASQGRYLSRNLHQVIKNIIARAMEAFAATGLDPSSVLPEDDWFAEVSQVTIEMLSGNANQDVPSPTASI